MTRLVICSKSAWHPAIRREHQLARLAADAGHDTVFVERPRDVRSLIGGRRLAWARGLRRPRVQCEETVTVMARSTVVPAHRGALAGRLDERLLASLLGELAGQVMVAMVPWDWPAVSRCSNARRVFDCADDWSQILPHRRARMRALYGRIAAEADVVICASDRLATLFASREVAIVPNGTPAALLTTPPTARPRTSTMVYAGTMSERFDAPLVDAVLLALPGWRLELYGPCQYAGRDGAPDTELAGLLDRWPTRTTWHGPVARERLTPLLDAGDVLVIPHRLRGAVGGGDAMKFYDYAARGRPVVTTRWSEEIAAIAAPRTQVADTPAEFAAAVRDAATEPEAFASTRRSWAEANAWQTRWPAWAAAALG